MICHGGAETQRTRRKNLRNSNYWNAATACALRGRRILQDECYLRRYVFVNIILRVTENRQFIGDAVAEFAIWNSAGPLYWQRSREADASRGGKPDVRSRYGAPAIGATRRRRFYDLGFGRRSLGGGQPFQRRRRERNLPNLSAPHAHFW